MSEQVVIAWLVVALFGILYSLAINAINHLIPEIVGDFVWLEVVMGVAGTLALTQVVMGDLVSITFLYGQFAITGGCMVAGCLARYSRMKWQDIKRSEELAAQKMRQA